MLNHPCEQEFNTALKQYHALINYNYLDKLDSATLVPKCKEHATIKLFKIKTFTSNTTYSFFTYIFDALATTASSISFILDKTSTKLDFYVGLKCSNSPDISTQIFSGGFVSTFPNSEIKLLSDKEATIILDKIFSPNNACAITSSITIPSNSDSSHIPILEKYTQLFDTAYTTVFLAEPICTSNKQHLLDEFLSLYNLISQFTQSTNTLSKSIAHNSSCTYSTNQTESSGNSCTLTDNHSSGCSSAAYNNISPSTTVPLGESKRVVNLSVTFNNATGCSKNEGSSTAKGENSSCSQCTTESNLTATNSTDSHGFSYTKQNKMALDSLTTLSTLISRIRLATTLFSFSAFFLSPSAATSIRAGFTYNGLANDLTTNFSPNFVYTWLNDSPTYKPLLYYLRTLSLPLFKYPHQSKPFLAGVTITSNELTNTFYFPSSDSTASISSSLPSK